MQIFNHNYSKAASDELTYLLEIAAQSNEGAISYMANEAQLWWVSFHSGTMPFIDLVLGRTLLTWSHRSLRTLVHCKVAFQGEIYSRLLMTDVDAITTL